jgi:hypothetical protein
MPSRRTLVLAVFFLFHRCFIHAGAGATAIPGAAESVCGNEVARNWPESWRRTKSAAGHASQPYTFYIGVTNGGVWKTTDAGRTWAPIFDDQETGFDWRRRRRAVRSQHHLCRQRRRPGTSGSLGWRRHVQVHGRREDMDEHWPSRRQQIPNIAVDPKNANRLFVAVAGHPYGPSKDRAFTILGGGRTWQAVLQKDENVGGADVDIDPADRTLFMQTLWEERQGPWEDAQWRGTGAGIYKSTDGGSTWRQLKGGLPGDGSITQANLAVAPSNSKRLYAAVAVSGAATFWRSDARARRGRQRMPAAWAASAVAICRCRPSIRKTGRRHHREHRVEQVHRRGKTWTRSRCAGGDDYQNVWINPNDTNIFLLAADQGAVVT